MAFVAIALLLLLPRFVQIAVEMRRNTSRRRQLVLTAAILHQSIQTIIYLIFAYYLEAFLVAFIAHFLALFLLLFYIFCVYTYYSRTGAILPI